MNFYDTYKIWLENQYFDKATREELLKIKDNENEIEERFYKDLEFGTGGLRGVIGAGTNRMNVYTVRKVSQGLAAYLSKINNGDSKGIVIAYDCRYMSNEFALEAAKVFAKNGIKVWLFDELRPTPELSFAVRYLRAAAGIVITASHNPKEYNGYKVYGSDGSQLSLEASNAVLDEINLITDITRVDVISKEEALNKGLLNIIGQEIDTVYINSLKTLSINKDILKKAAKSLRLVYTPLHGSGNKLVRRVLKETGFDDVIVVPEQEKPDPFFSTVKSPNPEDKSAFSLAIELAVKNNADLIIGTDPDSDRLGVLTRDESNQYTLLTGNQTGCLLLDYILSSKKLAGSCPENGFVVKTIVTTELARKIANKHGVEIVEVLTGFKFIGEQIKLLDEFGNKKFLFGFEESYGYLAGTFARDKDGVVTSMLVAEMAAFYKSKGMTLYDVLQKMYEDYGFEIEGLTSFTQAGKEGLEKISKVMHVLRSKRISEFNDSKASAIRDYLIGERYDIIDGSKQKLELPESDVLYYEMVDGSWFCIRPSGTEPKIKIYYGVTTNSISESKAKLDKLKEDILGVMVNIL